MNQKKKKVQNSLLSTGVLLLLYFSFFLPGCASGGYQRRFEVPPPVSLASQKKLFEYVGCMHIHSLFSHDSRGTLGEIVEAGKKSSCDFLITTDHNSLGLLPYEGKYGNLLLIVGCELSTPIGHVIALRIPRMPSQRHDVVKMFQEIKKMGGMAIAAHPDGDRKPWRGPLVGFMGAEILNLGTEAKTADLSKLIPGLLFCYPFDRRAVIASLLERTNEELAFYDKISIQRPLTLLAGVDAHAIPLPGGKILMYSHVFPIARLHVWAPRLTKSSILTALEKGRVFVGIDLLKDSTTFIFKALQKGKEIAIMGDSISFQKGLELVASTPFPARIVLFRNGKEIYSVKGKSLHFTPQKAGVYRIEGRLNIQKREVPWIYSNPIWIQPKSE